MRLGAIGRVSCAQFAVADALQRLSWIMALDRRKFHGGARPHRRPRQVIREIPRYARNNVSVIVIVLLRDLWRLVRAEHGAVASRA